MPANRSAACRSRRRVTRRRRAGGRRASRTTQLDRLRRRDMAGAAVKLGQQRHGVVLKLPVVALTKKPQRGLGDILAANATDKNVFEAVHIVDVRADAHEAKSCGKRL